MIQCQTTSYERYKECYQKYKAYVPKTTGLTSFVALNTAVPIGFRVHTLDTSFCIGLRGAFGCFGVTACTGSGSGSGSGGYKQKMKKLPEL